MMKPQPSLESHLESDRVRLVRLCIRLTGDPHLAEDLAQEALLIGWQKRGQLRDEAKHAQWLNGIARNLCRSWMRRHTAERASIAHPTLISEDDEQDFLETIPDSFDLETELEHSDLCSLLDTAMAKLPELTRNVLVNKYIHGLPQAEVAGQLGLTEGAVEARTHRGKLTLRRVLTTDLQDEAATFGLGLRPEDEWQETRLWCRACGQKKLKGKFSFDSVRSLQMCCQCGTNIGIENFNGILDGVRGFGPARTRAVRWWHAFYQKGLMEGIVPCLRCDRSVMLHRTLHPDMPPGLQQFAPAVPGTFGVWSHCPTCQWWTQADLEGLAGHFAELTTFERDHKRIVTLSPQTVETAGGPTIVVSFQKLGGTQKLDMLFNSHTLQRVDS